MPENFQKEFSYYYLKVKMVKIVGLTLDTEKNLVIFGCEIELTTRKLLTSRYLIYVLYVI